MSVVTTDLSVFSEVLHFRIRKSKGKETRECFSEPRKYVHRSSAIDYWLPIQPKTDRCVITRVTIGSERVRLRDLVALIVGAEDSKGQKTHFADQLKSGGHFLSLPQVEVVIDSNKKPRQQHYAFVLDKNDHICVIRVFGRVLEGTFGVNLSQSHHAEPGDLFYFRNLSRERFPDSQ